MSETVEWAIALSETVEWAIAMLVAPLEFVLRHCFWILFEFQVIRKGCIFTRPRIANRRWLGMSQPLEVVLDHWRLFFSIRFEFQVIRKGCEGSGNDS